MWPRGLAQGGGEGLPGLEGTSLLGEGWCRQWGLLGDHRARGRAKAEREAQGHPHPQPGHLPAHTHPLFHSSGIRRKREGPL